MGRVLVINDDRRLCGRICRMLARLGHEAWATPDLETALPMVQGCAFDVIALQISMLEMDDVELTGLLTELSGMPVLAISDCLTDPATMAPDYARKFGAAGLLCRPFNIHALETAIEICLTSRACSTG